jgi:hypothetical protein
MIAKSLTAPRCLIEAEALDARSHRAVDHDDAAFERFAQAVDGRHRP